MIIEIKIPSPGESISEVEIASWLVSDGDVVEKDQEVAEVESDKATLPLIASEAGKIKILANTGETIKVGTVACTVDTSFTPENNKKESPVSEKPEETNEPVVKESKTLAQEESQTLLKQEATETKKLTIRETKAEETKKEESSVKVTPLARNKMKENGLSVDDILKGLKKITSKEVDEVMSYTSSADYKPDIERKITRESSRNKMSMLRRKLSQRLVAVKNETAMLTTFNEVDMSEVISLRKLYQKQFVEKHGIKLGFMSFFTKAATEALLSFPKVNSYIDGEELVTPSYTDIGIAVQTDKGLTVPILRNTEVMSLADMEKLIADLATKARANRLSIEEMTGGTFTITNGGIFGSMLSTPILNPPQAAILGMHNIVERPVAINGKVEIRPIMYVALSYDHRIIDGRDSVSFLKKIKELIESPRNMLFGTKDPDRLLLGL